MIVRDRPPSENSFQPPPSRPRAPNVAKYHSCPLRATIAAKTRPKNGWSRTIAPQPAAATRNASSLPSRNRRQLAANDIRPSQTTTR